MIGKRIANQIARMDEFLASETLNFKVELAEEQVNKIRKETEVLNGQLIKLRDEHAREPAIVKEINSRIYLNNMNATLAEARKRLTEAEITTEGQEFLLKLAETQNVQEATGLIKQQVKTELERTNDSRALAKLHDAQATIAKFEQELGDSKWSKFTFRVGELTGAIGNLLGGSASLVKALK